MKTLVLLALTFLFVSCGLITADKFKDLSPEQIDAYNRVGSDVYACLNIAGPPPAGGTTFLILPKSRKAELAFSGNCQLLKGTVQ